MTSKWKRVAYGARENPGCYDTGNGAIAVIMVCADYPGIERVTVSYYAKGRGPGYTYFRKEEDASGAFVRAGGRSWNTLRAAVRGEIGA